MGAEKTSKVELAVADDAGEGRREHPRHSLRTRVAVRAADWASLEAECVDISYGGLGLVFDAEVLAGDELIFGLTTQDAKKERLVAVVRHTTQLADGRWRAGLAWRINGAAQQSAIESFVDEIAPGGMIEVRRAA